MKSTLPALFRINSRQKQSRIGLSPQKQIPYYNLNLTISHSYRTKIVNPQHKRSSAEDKLPAQSVLKFKQRYSEYPSRSLSVHHNYSSEEFNTIDPVPIKSQPTYTLQQIDNVRINIKKVKQELHLLTVAMGDVPSTHQQYKKQIQATSKRLTQDIDEVQKEAKEKIGKLGELLSKLRRETNIELRGMKRDLDIMKDHIEEEKELIRDIDEQRVVLRKVNF